MAIPVAAPPGVLEGVILVPHLFRGGHRITFSIPRVVDLASRVLSAGQGASTLEPRLRSAGLDLAAIRELNGEVASRFAITGSDLFLAVGSDITLVIDAIDGQAPALQAQPDARWLSTHLEASETDAFFVLGRGFVERTTGQAMQTLHMRRQALLFELRRPGYAELLFRQVHGRAPSDAKEPLATSYPTADDLVHHDGEPIRWEPGQRARSVHGTQERLAPALGEPLPERVSPRVRDAYRSYRAGYRRQFSVTGPVLLTAQIAPETKRLKVSLVQQPAARSSMWLREHLEAYVDVRGPSANTEMPLNQCLARGSPCRCRAG